VLRVTRQHLFKAKLTSIQLRETLIENALKFPPHCLSLPSTLIPILETRLFPTRMIELLLLELFAV
jgi:hypothetical protein